MKAIKIKCYQQVANFKKPASFDYKDTYPLPPYSTVIGFIHAMCGFKDYVDMDVSIQGAFSCIVPDIATEYVYKEALAFKGKDKDKSEGEKARHQIYYESKGKLCGVTKTVNTIEDIIDLELTLHIVPKDERYIDIIYKGLKNPKVYPSLGRKSDLVRIDEISIHNLNLLDESDDDYGLQLSKLKAYLPITEEIRHELGNMYATYFNLGKKFSRVGKLRRWDERVEALYISEDSDTYVTIVDEDNKPVYLA